MEGFDEHRLLSQLQLLPGWKQVAFMVLCCERMIPNFDRFSKEAGFGDAAVLRIALDVAWRWLETDQLPMDLDSLRSACEEQAPSTEDFRSEFTSAALDAANAVATVLDALERWSASNAAEVAALARDTVDLYVQASRNLDPASPSFEADILADPLMQTELRRQREDLEELISLGEDRSFIVTRMRKRSSQRGAGSLST